MMNQSYSVRDVILRYESEEDEFVRELEQMMTSENNEIHDHEIDSIDGPPILSVLCSLVDEIGSLRTENRRLKTRLVSPPTSSVPRATRNVVQRVSAMFENRGSSIFPRLRRSNVSNDSIEIRNGARERLSTPPRKETNTTTTSSSDYERNAIPPIVRPEMSDSDIDEHIFDVDDEHRSRDTTRRCDSVAMKLHLNDNSTSAYTSPSSASSSRDPSEIMTTSRSSFLDLFGFRRRSTHIPYAKTTPTTTTTTTTTAATTATKQMVKKRRKKLSGNDSESSGMYTNVDDDRCCRNATKPPRPASYYRRDDSEDSDYLKQSRQRKSASFLNVNSYPNENVFNPRVNRETQMQHEKDNLMAEIEEMKMRNQRLVEQLREKSQQQSKLQCQLHKAEMQVSTLSRKCALSEALDRLTFDERLEKSATATLKKMEERFRVFENQMQNAKLEAANAHQMTLNSTCNERIAHQNCLEKLENLQREHLRFIQARFKELGSDEATLRRRLENLPTYEALYTFTHSVVRRLNDARWAIIEKTNEASRAQMDLIASQSSLLVAHAQIERLRIGATMRGKRQKRPASFHGHDTFERNIRHELSFYLPFKLQGSRVENARRKRGGDNNIFNDRNIEEEFLKLFSYSKEFDPPPPPPPMPDVRRVASNRIETMMREMNGNVAVRRDVRRPSVVAAVAIQRDRSRNDGQSVTNRRPISMVETEERRNRRNEETRRSIKFMKTNSIDHQRIDDHSQLPRTGAVKSSQDIRTGLNSPLNTPIIQRRIIIPTKANVNYDLVAADTIAVPQMGRVRKLERAFSTESRHTVDSLNDREELQRKKIEYGRGDEERRTNKIQRSQPVSRIKQPSTQLSRYRTIESSQQRGDIAPTAVSSSIQRPRTLDPPPPPTTRSPPNESRIPTPSNRFIEKRTWFDRLKGIGK